MTAINSEISKEERKKELKDKVDRLAKTVQEIKPRSIQEAEAAVLRATYWQIFTRLRNI